PACWKPESVFSDGGGTKTEKETKEVKTLAPPSRACVFEILLPLFLTFIAFCNIIEIVRVG
ncbi:hypothetical protein COZ26_04280, partial [Candidatus Kuenenbacteria bacterium CG_4_10_14_3_um_filter_39_14]